MSLRIITQYKPAGTRSFRLSATKVFSRYGMNLQNPDKDTMDIACAPPGHVIIQPDQAGAEAFVVAYLTRPGEYRALFENGVKPHTYLAMRLFPSKFNLTPQSPFLRERVASFVHHPDWPALHKKIKKSGVPYDIGKRTAHGSSYRMGPYTFRNANLKQSEGTLRLSIKECREFLEMFRTLFPEVVDWQDEIEMTIRGTRKLTNLFGFVRMFMRNMTDSYIREGISWIPQSTVGCITHRCIRACRREKLSVCSNKHDSAAAIVPLDEARQVARFMTEAMRCTLQGRDKEFTMASEVKIGYNWRDFDAEDNPRGMQDASTFLEAAGL